MPKGVQLSRRDKDIIYSTYLITGKKTETARRLGYSLGAVTNCVKEIEESNDPLVKKAAAGAIGRLSNKARTKADEILDSISTEDLKSGLLEITDKDGKVTGYKSYGPNLLQKATSIGILSDKLGVLENCRRAILQDEQAGNLMIPGTEAALIAGIQNKLKEIKILNVRFADDVPDLAQKVQDAVIADELKPPVQEAEYIDLESFDNPRSSNASSDAVSEE